MTALDFRASFFFLCVFPRVALGASEQRFVLDYELVLDAVVQGEGPVEVYMPLLQEDEQQEVLEEEVLASFPGAVQQEAVHGNRFWHGQRSTEQVLRVRVHSVVERRVQEVGDLSGAEDRELTKEEKRRFALYLGSNARVPIDASVLDPILAQIHGDSLRERARATFDWVVDNLEYKKVGQGWGNGDVVWACSQRSGNCTDFHSLFIALARRQGIPARFVMGLPIPEDESSGQIEGYHCWVEFYLPGLGWVPADASEARKHPERRDQLFGQLPADRVVFSLGRDLLLDAGQGSGALNYFINPLLEQGGKALKGVKRTVRFRRLAPVGGQATHPK